MNSHRPLNGSFSVHKSHMRWNKHDTRLPVVDSSSCIVRIPLRPTPRSVKGDCFTARMLFLCGILLLISDAALAAVVRAREGSLVWALVDGRRMMTRKVTDQGRGRR